MKEKFKIFIDNVKLRQIRALVILVGIILAVVATSVSAFYLVIVSKNDSTKIANSEPDSKNLSEADSIVAVVGAEDSSIIGNTKSNNSWSGEIISLNNLQVQPDREGTISQWYVRIGGTSLRRPSYGQAFSSTANTGDGNYALGKISNAIRIAH